MDLTLLDEGNRIVLTESVFVRLRPSESTVTNYHYEDTGSIIEYRDEKVSVNFTVHQVNE